MSKIIELAKKLRELSIRGVGGEKVNAEEALNKLMEKHKLTMQDIEGEVVSHYQYVVEMFSNQLFIQVCSMVIGRRDITYTRQKDDIKIVTIQCTAAQSLEIRFKYDHYLQLFIEELDIFTMAFITKNEIFNKDIKEMPVQQIQYLDMAEFQRRERVRKMSESINKRDYQIKIGGNGERINE